MFQIPQRQYWSCMGETVLKKTEFDKSTAEARANNRANADQLARQNTQDANAFTLPAARFISQMGTAQIAPQPQNRIIQFFVQTFAPIAQAVTQPLQNIAQQLSQLFTANASQQQRIPSFLEKAMSQVISFFFGNTKEAGKDDIEEREKRERNEALMTDIFGEGLFNQNKVSHKDNAGLNSGKR